MAVRLALRRARSRSRGRRRRRSARCRSGRYSRWTWIRLRAGVAHGVGDRFLPDAQQLLFDARNPARRRARRRRRRPPSPVDAVACSANARSAAAEVAAPQRRRAQVPDRVTRLADVLLDLPAHPDQLHPACVPADAGRSPASASNCSATPTRLCSSVSWISRLRRVRSCRSSENSRRTCRSRRRQAPHPASATSATIAAENQRVW